MINNIEPFETYINKYQQIIIDKEFYTIDSTITEKIPGFLKGKIKMIEHS